MSLGTLKSVGLTTTNHASNMETITTIDNFKNDYELLNFTSA